ncbi:MarR family transcriptional regulator [Patescibacteria group bacterium]|nr:MarR family transcriptional regulator [Patescibacteria group bacterium]
MDKDMNDQIIELLFSIFRQMREKISFYSKTAHLSLLQIQALHFISKENGVKMKELADNFSITLPTATALSDNLLKLGFVKRARKEKDRRIVRVRLSASGARLLKKAMRERKAKIETMVSYLSAKDKKNLVSILSSLLENIKKVNEK